MVSFLFARFFHIAQQSRKERKDQTHKAFLKIWFIKEVQLPNHIALSFIFLKWHRSMTSHWASSGLISPQKTDLLGSYTQIPLFLDSLKPPALISHLWNMLNYEKSIILPTWHKKRGGISPCSYGNAYWNESFWVAQTHWLIWLFSHWHLLFLWKVQKFS